MELPPTLAAHAMNSWWPGVKRLAGALLHILATISLQALHRTSELSLAGLDSCGRTSFRRMSIVVAFMFS
ncbi:hypothetical protein LB505_012484 [Fusarium chuoi]|nr:hypothetical protein LB505_012484 [Fusarium chuoi]